jgi:hypothetical protein
MIADMFLGILMYLILKGYRFMRAPGADKSNAFNFLRVEFMDAIHAGERAQQYYLTDEEVDVLVEAGYSPQQPYKFISGDEFSDHFPDSRLKK